MRVLVCVCCLPDFVVIAYFGLSTCLSFQSLYDEALPAFDVLGKKSFFLGEVGNGARMKLVVNMIMGR